MDMPDKVREYLHAILLLSGVIVTFISLAIFWTAVTLHAYLIAAATFVVGLLLLGAAAILKPKETKLAIDALPEFGRLEKPED